MRQLLRYFLLLEQRKLVSAEASQRMREIFESPEIAHDDIKFVKGLKGRVRVPGDKSISHRYAMIASIAGMLCFNYYFLPPVGKWSIADSQNSARLRAISHAF